MCMRRPLSDAGPLIALRYDGDGPNFQIEQTICRNCGKLSSVREVLRNRMAQLIKNDER